MAIFHARLARGCGGHPQAIARARGPQSGVAKYRIPGQASVVAEGLERIALMRTERAAAMPIFIFLLSASILVGCAGRPREGVLVPSKGDVVGTSLVPVFVVTNRKRSDTDPGEMFNGERSDELSYAAITVSIPPDSQRKIGDVQWPGSLPGDPQKDFVTVAAVYIDKQGFAASVSAAAKQADRSRVLVFVHGFNNRFDDSVYRLAQIVHDSGAPVIPVLFAWPSRGELRLGAYTYDRESANFSRDELEHLLSSFDVSPNIREVDLLAHSMGNWIALEALRARSIDTSAAMLKRSKLKNVMMVAPDVDVDVFGSELRRMGNARPPISLFVSSDDQALALSKSIWGDMPRLGDIDPEQEPYRTELQQGRIEVYDLTKLATVGDDAHDRAFEQVTSVVAMIRQRMADGQVLSEQQSPFQSFAVAIQK
jgi:esterase/lipase superfamily enzyme